MVRKILPVVIIPVGIFIVIYVAYIWYYNRPQTLIKIYGSNTIGAELAPNLAGEFLQKKGAKDIQTVTYKDKTTEKSITGKLKGKEVVIEVKAHGSSTAFECLKKSECDIGMSSRSITSEENKELNNPKEEVIALDGIAIIVHKDNLVKKLSIQQIADIFSGKIKSWSQISDSNSRLRTITVYARDDKSGT